MYYRKFIDFLKKHNIYDEEIVEYFNDHSTRFDYLEDEYREFIGIYYLFDKTNTLKGLNIVVPYINNDKTILINVHEYIHLYMLYDKLDKFCVLGKDREVLPIFFERVFINENPTEELINYQQEINQSIYDNDQEEYLLALRLSDELNDYYDNQSFNKLNRKVKRLVLKDNFNRFINGE